LVGREIYEMRRREGEGGFILLSHGHAERSGDGDDGVVVKEVHGGWVSR
jgi:hypothetical protein